MSLLDEENVLEANVEHAVKKGCLSSWIPQKRLG